MEQNDSKTVSIGILGYGEVGQAVAKFYPTFRVKDLTRDDGLAGVEILHICIPWSGTFVETVKSEIEGIRPRLTIIHSSVAPGTTKQISLVLPEDLRETVVHSPVRGVHPNLYEGIQTFVKYVGADSEKAGAMAKDHLEGLGMRVKVFLPSVTTEIGKLLDTTYYGLCIAWHGEMKKICDRFGVNFDQAVTDFNESYNEGYTTLGKSNVVRPVLYTPEEGIGGHCICPNAEILKQFSQSKALDLVLEYKPKKSI